MSTIKKTVAVILMLVLILGGAVGGGYLFVLIAGPPFPLTAAADYALAVILFCFLMLSGFVGMCLGVLVFMLVLKPFTSKAEMHETFISDPNYRCPRTTHLLETLIDVIY